MDLSRYGYFFIAPFFLIYLVFQAYPLLNTIYLAFQKYMITGTNKVIGPTFVGLANFKNVLVKGSALQAFENTAVMWLITSLIGGMQIYDIPQMMQMQGSPAKTMTVTVTMYIMELVYTGTKDYVRGAAVSVLLFLVTAVLSIILFYVMRDRDAARERKVQKKARKEARA